MNASVLLADDDSSLRFVLSQALTKEGFQVRATSNVQTLSKWVKEGEGDIVVSDVFMGDSNVFDELPLLRAARPSLPIIVMSAQSTVTTALSAAGAGAYDYLPKPFDLDDLMSAIRRALSQAPDAKSRVSLAKGKQEERLPLIGRSRAMQDVYRTMARVAGADLTVLIEGESGAGKSRVARALHEHSRRRAAPFVTLNLAGIAAGRLEEEFSAPGGKRDQARDGALYLEDVDEAPGEAQVRLAGLLQAYGEGQGPRPRIIAGAQRSLAGLVRAGGFRGDLFYRLNVVAIRIPPLRERLDDIGDLARAFLVRASRDAGPEKTLEAGAVDVLKAHDWPGNVRELDNLLRRLAALSPANVITAQDVAAALRADRAVARDDAAADESFEELTLRRLRPLFTVGSEALESGDLYEQVLADVERPLIRLALQATKGNQVKAASLLGINRNTLRKKIQVLGVRTAAD
ncbi:MAG: response regulator [Alphaproteobacteria bacterium]|nr:response regulator [Alphaproteobacteria bacterium]